MYINFLDIESMALKYQTNIHFINKELAAKDIAQLGEMPHPGIKYIWDMLKQLIF